MSARRGTSSALAALFVLNGLLAAFAIDSCAQKSRTGTLSCDPEPDGCPEQVAPCDDPGHPDFGTIVCCAGAWDPRLRLCDADN